MELQYFRLVRSGAKGLFVFKGAAEFTDLDERGGDLGADRVDHGLHHLLAVLLVGLAVCGDQKLGDTTGRLNLDMLLGREQRLQPTAFPVSE